jgi:hypothetical protein
VKWSGGGVGVEGREGIIVFSSILISWWTGKKGGPLPRDGCCWVVERARVRRSVGGHAAVRGRQGRERGYTMAETGGLISSVVAVGVIGYPVIIILLLRVRPMRVCFVKQKF